MVVSLVTGAAGFIGKHLVPALQKLGDEVYCVDLQGDFLDIGYDNANIIEADIRSKSRIKDVLATVKPTRIYHLAALIKSSNYDDLFSTNVLGTNNLLESIIEIGLMNTRVLVAGSAAEYGYVDSADLPITEENQLKPVSLYGLSKVVQGLLAQMYFLNHHIPIIRTRSFNISGPGEPDSLVTSAIARQIAEIEKILADPQVTIGKITSERDFVDVRDISRGLISVMENGTPGLVYNLCSGVSTSIKYLVNYLVGLSKKNISVNIDTSRSSTYDIEKVYGDPSLVFNHTAWKASIPIEETMRDLLFYWREIMEDQNG